MKGYELIMKRLHRPEPDVEETLLSLLETQLLQPQGEWEMTEAVHRQIRAVFGQVLTQEDWDEIAASARDYIYAQVLKQGRVAVERL